LSFNEGLAGRDLRGDSVGNLERKTIALSSEKRNSCTLLNYEDGAMPSVMQDEKSFSQNLYMY